MSKSVLVAFAVVALAAGCVTVGGPSAAPSVSPTFGITTPHPATATPNASPSAAPSAEPTATAGSTASSGPSASNGPTAQPSGDLGFDQRDVIYFDDLVDPTGSCGSATQGTPPGCWGVGTTAGGSIAYANGNLQFDTTADGAWLWSRRVADSTSATMRVIGDFHPTADGRFGVLCASGDTQLFGALVGTDGSWAFVTIPPDDPNGAQELLGDASAGLAIAAGASNLVALECTGTATGALRLTLWLGKSGPIATYTQADGPANFDRGAAYVVASSTGFSVAMDNLVLFGSRISDGSFSPEGEQLLPHVPTDWQSSCYQGLRPPYLASTADAVLTCSLPAHDGAEIAEYAAYSTIDSMNAAYNSRISAFGTGDNNPKCQDGSGEHGYHFGTDENAPEAGRLLCVDQFSGIRFDWTDTRLNILGTLVDFDGNFAQTFADWGAGGPNL